MVFLEKHCTFVAGFDSHMNIIIMFSTVTQLQHAAGRGRRHSGPSGPGETHRDSAGGDRLPEEDPRRGLFLLLFLSLMIFLCSIN